MRNALILALLLLGVGLTLAACGDAPPTITPLPPTPTATPTATPVPTATVVPPVDIMCGVTMVTASVVDSGPGTEGGHAIGLVQAILAPGVNAPTGPWQAVQLYAPFVNWTSSYLVTAGRQEYWVVVSGQVTAVNDAAKALSTLETPMGFPACTPALDAVAAHLFTAAPLP